jgi:hypothetical protein
LAGGIFAISNVSRGIFVKIPKVFTIGWLRGDDDDDDD